MERTTGTHANQAEEFLSSLGSVTENTQHAARHSGGARLLNAAHGHAHMFRFHNDGHALRLQRLVNSQSHLLRETLLDLEPPRKCLCNTSEL